VKELIDNNMMDEKQRKKELKKQWQLEQQKKFEESLPISREQFAQLFDRLDEYLEKQGCNHTNILTVNILDDMRVTNKEEVIEWLREHGGYCDCEVLWNVEECF
jgi:glutamate/tyrosine decarboxylase-like PLP-dependent enzyme